MLDNVLCSYMQGRVTVRTVFQLKTVFYLSRFIGLCTSNQVWNWTFTDILHLILFILKPSCG